MKDISLSSIGKRIKEIRTENGLSLTQVADKSGVTAGLLSRIENFRTIPSLPVLLQIAKALQVTMSELVFSVTTSEEVPFLVIRKNDWAVEQREDSEGMVYNSILSEMFKGSFVKVNMVIIEPKIHRPAIANDALEIIHVIEGQVKYGFPQADITLSKGDTLYFDGRHPHSVENLSDENSELFVVYLSDPK